MADTAVLDEVPETRFGRWFLGTRIWQRYVVEAAVEQFMRLLPSEMRTPEMILDAGCGAGVSLPVLDQAFAPKQIVAVDVDSREIQRCRERVSTCACDVKLAVADASRLEHEDASFDMVFCHQTLHHTLKQSAVLREFHRVLAPGGWLLLAESCRAFISSAPVRVLFRHPVESQRSAAEYQQMVREAGFAFDQGQVLTARPFWSLPAWGLLERMRGPSGESAEPALVMLVARKAPDERTAQRDKFFSAEYSHCWQ